MERRKAIKSLGFGLGSLAVLPTWAQNWSLSKISTEAFKHEATLASLVDCIIPETESPGAKSIGAHVFVERIIRECYGEDALSLLNDGLKQLEENGFASLNIKARQNKFLSLENSSKITDKRFFSGVKSLTIRAYTQSEYYLKNYRGYTMTPGFFHGCVAV